MRALILQARNCGEYAGNAKLTWKKVRSIRKQANAGIERSVLAKNFGVTKENIGYIVTGVTWKEEKSDEEENSERHSNRRRT